jgi:hypothetical protein
MPEAPLGPARALAARQSRVTRLGGVLSQCRETMAAPDPPFASACAGLVTGLAGELALVVFSCSAAAGPYALVASAGEVTALPGLHLATPAEPHADLIGAALLQDRPVVCRRSRNDPAHTPWAERAWRAGFEAACAVPFGAGPGRSGVLAVYSRDPEAFGADEFELLVDLAAALDRR